ncbi:Clp amino terminal domain protein [Rubellimicrobium thermophilum DSM 16684]|uniref:Clp amino terminal domain protein n=1 Tax=Rubellimicrobium thermophilum DSM 16684 TaxID=1123069 RepID=S9QRW7_9RHOB|nr:Clp amino terminal domain protein [Rubellimicrobium thermophilum DSM 16684]
MNLEKFTERSRGFLQAAQTIATREHHQRILPEHLLKALMDDEQGLSATLIDRAGGSSVRVREAVDAAVARLPRVTGDTGQIYVDPALGRVLDEAEKLAQKAGDRFVPVERMLLALAMVKSRASEALEAGAGHGAAAQCRDQRSAQGAHRRHGQCRRGL